MKLFFALIILCLIAQVAFAQQKVIAVNSDAKNATPTIRFYNLLPQRNWIRVREFPVFKTKADSLEAVALETQVNMPVELPNKLREKRWDSLVNKQKEIFTNRITGTYKVYYPNPKYYSLDSLLKTKNYAEVKQLSISNRSSIPDEVLLCSNLEKIEFINTSIDEIPDKLNALTHLLSIEVYNNKSKAALRLGENQYIKSITLQYNEPKSLPRTYKSLKNLESLKLNHDGLTQFVNGARRNKNLKILDLSDNKISLNHGRIAKHKNLKSLTATRNNITTVPASIKKLKALAGLTLAYNSINLVSPKIGRLKSLVQLSFYKNELPSIPSGVFKITGLRVIDLYYNQIETIPDNITDLQRLAILYVSFNKLTSVSNNLGKLTDLHEVYLHNNRISSLPESFGNLKEVKILRINDNYLTQLPLSLANLSKLEILDMARNNINTLSFDPSLFSNLANLDLSGNPWSNPAEIAALVKKLENKSIVVKNFPIE